jgi:tRNA (cytidine/uridine-2'-O-)-methyltransferase
MLLLGNESRGAPEALHRQADLRVRVPMVRGRRSLNLVTAGAIVLGEAMRQTCAFERLESGREPSGDDVEQEDE